MGRIVVKREYARTADCGPNIIAKIEKERNVENDNLSRMKVLFMKSIGMI